VDALPSAPADLTLDQRSQFNLLVERLEAIKVASETDTEIIAITARRLQEIVDLSGMLAVAGRVVQSTGKDGRMMLRSHPAVGQLNEAYRHLHSLLSELGLTPAARSKVIAKAAKTPKARFNKRDL
jgi:P27 family predicted phage terminase small subunit